MSSRLWGSGDMLPQKMFKLRGSEMPFSFFKEMKTKENTIVSCILYPSLGLSVRSKQ